jgi:hypothetical protein
MDDRLSHEQANFSGEFKGWISIEGLGDHAILCKQKGQSRDCPIWKSSENLWQG